MLIAPLLLLACGEPSSTGSGPAAGSAGGNAAKPEPAAANTTPEPVSAAATSPVSVAEAIAEVEAAAAAGEAEPNETGVAEPNGEPAEAEPTAPAEPADPLAPILPSGPEPGSPEADAELAELLDESTLTQEEFDKAFKGSNPKIDGDQFVFGAGDRTRKAPKLTIGTPTVAGSKLAASEVKALAEADRRKLEGCLAVALSSAPNTKGSVTLRVVFDDKGAAKSATSEGGASLGAPLRECLSAVAREWSLAGAAGATVSQPLTLSGE